MSNFSVQSFFIIMLNEWDKNVGYLNIFPALCWRNDYIYSEEKNCYKTLV